MNTNRNHQNYLNQGAWSDDKKLDSFSSSFQYRGLSSSAAPNSASLQRQSGGSQQLESRQDSTFNFGSNGAEPIRNRPPLFSVLDDKRVPRRPLNSTLNRSEHFESPSVPQNLTFSTTNNGLKNGSGYPPVHSGPSPFSKQFGDSGPKSGFNLTSPQSATDKQGWMLRQAIPTPPNQQNPAPYSIILQDEVQYQPNRDVSQGVHSVKPEADYFSPPGGFLSFSSPSSSVLSSVQLEALWSTWIVVYGYLPQLEQHSLENILRKFGQYGDIESHLQGRGNWIFIKYVSPHQAERACSQNASFLNSGTMIAVNRMNSSLAGNMSVRLREDGQLVSLETDFGGPSEPRELPAAALLLEDASGLNGGEPGFYGGKKTSNLLGRGPKPIDGIPYQRRPPSTSSSALHHANGTNITNSLSNSNNSGSVTQKEKAKEAAGDDLTDIYVKPPRRSSICKQLMEYLFSFKY